MSNNKELTQLEREGLLASGLPIDTPSQLSDAFRLGMAHLQKQNDELRAKLADIQSKWESASGDISALFETQPMNREDGSFAIDGQSCHDLFTAIKSTPAQSLADIRAEAESKGAIKLLSGLLGNVSNLIKDAEEGGNNDLLLSLMFMQRMTEEYANRIKEG